MAIVVCWQLSPKFIVQIFLPSGTETNKDISNKCSEELLAYRIYRVFRKNCVFSQLTATSLSETFKALNEMRVYSHSFPLVIFCTTNSSRVVARERWQTFENSWKKTQYLMNTLYFSVHLQTIYLSILGQHLPLRKKFSALEHSIFSSSCRLIFPLD